jgi:hypothetical protein
MVKGVRGPARRKLGGRKVGMVGDKGGWDRGGGLGLDCDLGEVGGVMVVKHVELRRFMRETSLNRLRSDREPAEERESQGVCLHVDA